MIQEIIKPAPRNKSFRCIEDIYMADDDIDDCLFFKEALENLSASIHLTVVKDGEDLMELLHKSEKLPQLLFLDLNMPRKNGFTCLSEIKESNRLKDISVVILSTSYMPAIANQLYKNGAQYFIQKPADFLLLKSLIYQAINLAEQQEKRDKLLTGEGRLTNSPHFFKENFLLLPE